MACALGLAACATPPGPGASAAAAPLAGTRWVAVVDGAEPQSLPRLEFGEGGKLNGYTGCNMMSGTWRQEGAEARFGPIISTKRFCVGAGGEMEKRLMAALAPGARGVREGEKLVLIAPGGARFEFGPAAAS
ncbi:MAG TPA: META domain-containing protein [Usitatibacter sp.]|nr:META domain-containing protein [Usitatibacter sp.]